MKNLLLLIFLFINISIYAQFDLEPIDPKIESQLKKRIGVDTLNSSICLFKGDTILNLNFNNFLNGLNLPTWNLSITGDSKDKIPWFFYNLNFNKVYILSNHNSSFNFDNCTFDYFSISIDTLDYNLLISNSRIKKIKLESFSFTNTIELTNNKFDELCIRDCHLKDILLVKNSQIYKKLKLTHIKFDGPIEFKNNLLPDTIEIDNLVSSNQIDFIQNEFPQKSILKTDLISIDRIKIHFNSLRLFKDPKLKPDEINSRYVKLLENQKKDGFNESYKLLDLEYQKFYHSRMMNKYFGLGLYHFRKSWSNFGYNKEYIFSNSIIILVILFFPILLFFNLFIYKVYSIPNIRDAYQQQQMKHLSKYKYYLLRFLLAFYYTSIIFFGLRMQIENLNFEKAFAVSYVFIVYLAGLICTGVMVHYLIKG